MFKVIQELTVKVNGTIKTFQVGSVVKLPFQAAQMFIQQGKLEPVVEPSEPMSLNEKMCKMGENIEPGQIKPYIADIDNLSKAAQEFFEERSAILEFDGCLSREEAEQKASELTSIFFQKSINRITKFHD